MYECSDGWLRRGCRCLKLLPMYMPLSKAADASPTPQPTWLLRVSQVHCTIKNPQAEATPLVSESAAWAFTTTHLKVKLMRGPHGLSLAGTECL